jgi:hypothetical protein
MSWTAVNARRLARHHLAEPAAASADACAEVTRAMCGVHAQILSAAEVSLATRIAGTTRQQVRDALWTDRTLVKTHGPRGTVHLLPSRDLPMWTGALTALDSPMPGEQLLTAGQIDELAAGMGTVLADTELTTDELTEALADTVGPWAADPVMEAFQTTWPRWRWAQRTLAHRGALCFGPHKGRKVSYTSPQRWLPGFAPMDGTAALRELVKHYLHGYGPATSAEFARWLSAPKRWAAELFASLGDELEPVTLLGDAGDPGVTAWQPAGDPLPDERPRGLRLLPYFDAFGVGSHPRSLLFAGRAAERALANGQAGVYPLLLIDGQVAGVWHQRRSGKRLALTVEPLEPLSPARLRELEEQAARLAEILETGPPSLTIGTITVGPHA